MFKKLNPEEKTKFRAWARKNYVPYSDISGSWHPVIQLECALINSNLHEPSEALAVNGSAISSEPCDDLSYPTDAAW